MEEHSNNRKKKVLCPVEGKDNKTHWVRLGTAWVNNDNSINVWLDCLPVNGKLHLRDWDEPPREKREGGNLALLPGAAQPAKPVHVQDDMPF